MNTCNSGSGLGLEYRSFRELALIRYVGWIFDHYGIYGYKSIVVQRVSTMPSGSAKVSQGYRRWAGSTKLERDTSSYILNQLQPPKQTNPTIVIKTRTTDHSKIVRTYHNTFTAPHFHFHGSNLAIDSMSNPKQHPLAKRHISYSPILLLHHNLMLLQIATITQISKEWNRVSIDGTLYCARSYY